MAEERDQPESPEELRDHARETLTEFERRWNDCQKEWELALGSQMSRSFAYVTRVLDEESRPSDWFRDAFALWIRGYGTGKDLFEATYKLYSPQRRRG